MKQRYLGNMSYRRWLLNSSLKSCESHFGNNKLILDVGGNKNIGKKGYIYNHKNYICLNISKEANPDVIGSAFNLPFKDNTFDVVISTEVFEHLEYPFITANEVYRVLKKDGIFIGSAPFLFPIHGDPDDHFRFTNSCLKLFFKKFRVVKINSLGGYLGVFGLFLEQSLKFFDNKRIIRFLLRKLSVVLCNMDYANNFKGSDFMTTGWFWICQK